MFASTQRHRERNVIRRSTMGAAAGLVAALLATGTALGSESGAAPGRGPGADPALERPTRRVALPPGLRLAEPPAAAEKHGSAGNDRAGRAGRGHGEAARDDAGEERLRELAALAGAEARFTAAALVRERGLAEYYRVGFHEGLRSALADPLIGRRDYDAGRLLGGSASWALADGADAGRRLAKSDAGRDAAMRIAAEFADLDRTPRFDPTAPRPRPDFIAPARPRPELDDVFGGRPLHGWSAPPLPRRAWLDSWSWSAAELAACPDWSRFYDARWNDPERAFAWWLERRGARVRLSGPWERERFAALFQAAFRRQIARFHASELGDAFDGGFDDGWSYGVWARREHAWREGVRDGEDDAWLRAAASRFDAEYPRLYYESYRMGFDDWSHNPKPTIVDARPFDANDDGVFEPGEGLTLELEVANLGGGGGLVPLRLGGGLLAGDVVDSLSLPPRAVTRATLDRATVHGGLASGTRGTLRLAVGASDLAVPLEVAWPLGFVAGSLRLDRDNLAGSLGVEIALRNRSRRDWPGEVFLEVAGGPVRRVHVPAIGPGASTVVRFPTLDVEPLDLLAGEVRLALRVEDRGIVQDDLRHRVPEAATDLDNPDLVLFFVEIARGRPASAVEVVRARRLLIERLREDWRVAAAGRGNPYKRDLEQRAGETALGDLVLTWESTRRDMVRPEIFDGLSGEIAGLSRTLPGVHPLLRKSMRRLADALP